MINSRHTGMIIWIIKILRRLHDTFYKQNVLSLAFRQRVGVNGADGLQVKTIMRLRLPLLREPFLCEFIAGGCFLWRKTEKILQIP